MEITYAFDVDGTLTDSRQQIDAHFHDFFLDWIKDKNVYLLSGSDREKTIEQVGEAIINSVTGSFNNAGNVFFKGKHMIYQNDWNASEEMIKFLNDILEKSPFPQRTGTHFEHRIGMLNFSIIGRDCTYEQRLSYNKYDNEKKERKSICEALMRQFPDIEASIGGQISIDIYPKGKNKGQIVEIIGEPIHFFGDRTEIGGNDYDIAKRLLNNPNKVTQVKNWYETYEILKNL